MGVNQEGLGVKEVEALAMSPVPFSVSKVRAAGGGWVGSGFGFGSGVGCDIGSNVFSSAPIKEEIS